MTTPVLHPPSPRKTTVRKTPARVQIHPELIAAILLILGVGVAHADWRLVWSDEFEGTAIDTNRWTFDIGTGGPKLVGWGNNELEYYTSRTQNVSVVDGVLRIVARRESHGGANFTSARLKTQGKYAQRYGLIEFRARVPAGQGYWPALWLMPRDSVYGSWAASGEIDVMENKGRDPGTVSGALHYGGSWPNNVHQTGSYAFPAGESATNFHVYAIEWTTNAFRWSVDGQVYRTQTSWRTSGGAYPAPFDQPFYLIINLAVGGNFGGNPNDTTLFPGTMEVDYVRVYEEPTTPAAPTRPEAKAAPGNRSAE